MRSSRDTRQLEALNPEISAWVSANAGAGKTHVLVGRIARLLLSGSEPNSILCLTYTNAAAAEMAERVYRTLGHWATLDDPALRAALFDIGLEDASAKDLKRARQLFALALDTPGGFKIQTIHGFCERILQVFPLEAGMAPGFRVMEEKDGRLLLQQAREETLALAMRGSDTALSKALQRISRFKPADDLDTILDHYLKGAPELAAPGYAITAEQVEVELRAFFGLAPNLHLDEVQAEILNSDAAALRRCADALVQCLPSAKSKVSQNAEAGAELLTLLACRDDDQRIDALRNFFFLTKDGKPRKNARVSKTGFARYAEIEPLIAAERSRLEPLFIAHDGLVRTAASAALVTVAQDVLARFVAAKKRSAAYDFNDLIAVTRGLLRDRAAASWVLYKLDRSISHLLIDEAQDTSPAQWQIVEALTEEFFSGDGTPQQHPRTLLVVGDQKQSIYSFQGADVRIFDSSRQFFTARADDAKLEMRQVPLTLSYRSSAAVLQVVDQVFAEGQPARQALGVPGDEGLFHQAQRLGVQGLFELWPVTDRQDEPPRDIWTPPRDLRRVSSAARLQAGKIAGTIASWIGKRRLSGSERLVQAGDILLLFRRRSSLFDMLIGELRRLDVPVAGTDRLEPAEHLAVQDMLALMRAVTLSSDDYALACVLKSPLMEKPFSEEQLFAIAHNRGSSTLWQSLFAREEEEFTNAAAQLHYFQELAHSTRPFEFITEVLRLRGSSIGARGGPEGWDALAALLDAALQYEVEHAPSIIGFAEWFQAAHVEIKRDMETGAGEVRLMTVHASKGLEAPIVILPDGADVPSARGDNALLFVDPRGQTPLWRLSKLVPSPPLDALLETRKDEQQGEFCRLLYVALTRARDELFVSGAADKGTASALSWYGMVETALKDRPDYQPVVTLAQGPGLRLGAEPTFITGEDVRKRDNPPPVFMPELQPLEQESQRPAALSATSLAQANPYVFSPQAVRLGITVHLVLQHLPDIAPDRRHSYIAEMFRRHGLEEPSALALQAVFELPEADLLFGPASQAEVSVGMRLNNGRVLTGIIDRLVITDDEILILDYKSGARADELGADHPYVRQLAVYSHIMAEAYPGRALKAGILWTSTCCLDWVADTVLGTAIERLEKDYA